MINTAWKLISFEGGGVLTTNSTVHVPACLMPPKTRQTSEINTWLVFAGLPRSQRSTTSWSRRVIARRIKACRRPTSRSRATRRLSFRPSTRPNCCVWRVLLLRHVDGWLCTWTFIQWNRWILIYLPGLLVCLQGVLLNFAVGEGKETFLSLVLQWHQVNV